MSTVAIKTTLPGYIYLDEAADILGCSHATVWRYIDEKQLDCLKFGNTHLVRESDVRNFKRPPLGRPPISRRKRGS